MIFNHLYGRLAIAALTGINATAVAEYNPEFEYVLYCAGCHLSDGSGDPPEVPSLRADLDLFVNMPDGRSYLSRVPGSADAPISDGQLAAVLNWIVSEFYPGLEFSRYTADEVSVYRAEKPLLDPLGLRAELLSDQDTGGSTSP